MRNIVEICGASLARIRMRAPSVLVCPNASVRRVSPTKWQQKWLVGSIPWNDTTAAIADEVQRFVGAWCRNEPFHRLLILAGGCGTAKSIILKNLMTFATVKGSQVRETGVWGHNPECSLHQWEHLVNEANGPHHFIQPGLEEDDLLIIDNLEIGSTTSQNAFNALNFILCRREQKFTVLALNSDPFSWINCPENTVTYLTTNARICNLHRCEGRAGGQGQPGEQVAA